MRQACIQEFTFDGESTSNMHYQIVVYKGYTEVERIVEPTMQGAFDVLERKGYKIVR